jgi:hypothetical protein
MENNHTSFIRIKTNKTDSDEMLVLPVEVEVTSGRSRSCLGIYLGFQNGMVPSFKKRAFANKKRVPRLAAAMFW